MHDGVFTGLYYTEKKEEIGQGGLQVYQLR